MTNITLEDFIGEHRNELIRRCQMKVALRGSPPSDKGDSGHGVPLFLSQLCEQLRDGASTSNEIGDSAKKHGQELLEQGFTIEEVVHDYGDVCQSVTDLAVELEAPIDTDDFRTLNRCLDDAIAGAVTQFTTRQGITRDKEYVELEHLTRAAILAFRVIRTGGVGVGGSTAAVVERSLFAIRAALDARSGDPKQKKSLTPTPAA